MIEQPKWLYELKYHFALGMPGAQTYESHEAFFKLISDSISEKCDFYEVRQQFQSYVMREVLKFDREKFLEVAEMVDRAIAYNEAGRKDRRRKVMKSRLRTVTIVLIERLNKQLRESCHPDSDATQSDINALDQGHSALMAALSVVSRSPWDVVYHAENGYHRHEIQQKMADKLIELLRESSGIGGVK